MRTQIIDFLRKELIGPDPIPPFVQANGEEILVTDPPRLRYGAGILFPQKTVAEASTDQSPTEVTGLETEIVSTTPESPEPEIIGEEKIEATTEDPVDAADETISLANAFLPSAIGFSCLAELSEAGFVAEIGAAVYRSEKRRYETERGETREGRYYLRIPFRSCVNVSSLELQGAAVKVLRKVLTIGDGRNSGLELVIVSRNRLRGISDVPQRLLTVTLVNTLSSPSGRAENEKCFFQVKLKLRSANDHPCFLEYPEREGEPLDEEDASLALLYRHRKTYAIGHGCAAEWNEAVEGRADLVRTEIMPEFEIKPIVPILFEDLKLRMINLSDRRNEDDGIRLLVSLCDKYEAWINRQQAIVNDQSFPHDHLRAARRHLEKCRFCLSRMRSGLDLLRNDKTAMLAFRLANRAMLLQQLHYPLRLREWRLGDGGRPQIDPVLLPEIDNPPEGKGSWYPFQIAFILMNLKSLAIPGDSERGIVDLIWFPTGGGKTEAYLGLASFAILLRRLRDPQNVGTTVLMRYTLRLLTAQQFQRAASLICALETIRSEMSNVIGNNPFSIGLWVGMELTPNDRVAAVKALNNLNQGTTGDNPFILLKCPWCGAQMGPVRFGNQTRCMGYEKQINPSTVIFRCKDASCRFGGSSRLPLFVIDEDIYETRPTVVIGTVDKFAMLPWRSKARRLFRIEAGDKNTPPDLIIQDELHLISGPLGSMVGHYETGIQELCTWRTQDQIIGPKIIASTATICRAAEQCHGLYNCGIKNVFHFPPQCLRAGDSFFAIEDECASGRVYVGVHASALPSHVTAQVRVMASLLQAPLYATTAHESDRDPYWTLVGYFNSLRELGHAATLIRADIREYLNAMWLRKGIEKPKGPGIDRRRFINVALELTSRISSTEIPESLQKLELSYPPQGEEHPVDICLATNMISVGVDVPRLGLMAVIGQPKTTSEYIQATSRVGRRYPGVVVVIYNTGKPRDRSHYEHFRSYHASIYRQVEPTSVTSFAPPVRERALHALLITLVRYFGKQNNRERPQPFPDEHLINFICQIVRQRVQGVDPEEEALTMDLLGDRFAHWERVLPSRYGDFGPPQQDLPLMYPAGSEPIQDWENKAWPTPSSMRNVDANCEAAVIRQFPQVGGGGS